MCSVVTSKTMVNQCPVSTAVMKSIHKNPKAGLLMHHQDGTSACSLALATASRGINARNSRSLLCTQ